MKLVVVLLILALIAYLAWIVRPIVVTFEPEPISFAGGFA